MFHNARIKLTAWYLLIIMFVSVTFSVVIYQTLTREVERFGRNQRYMIQQRLEEDITLPSGLQLRRPVQVLVPDIDLIEESKQRILTMLIIINSGILAISGALGYILAGQTLSPIKSMVDEQNRFISDASHELKTPLTSLKIAFEVYLRNKKRTRKEADTIVRESIEEVDQLHRLSESLLTLARYQKTNGNTIMEPIRLDEVVKRAVKKITPIAIKKTITITESIVQLTGTGNRDGLIDLLVILLDNAVKYSPEKSAVSVSLTKSDAHAKITVADHGAGIAKKDIDRIFDRFFRADLSRTHETASGYGLGLSIAEKIVKLHHGFLTVTSEEGKGSTFTIKLPLTKTHFGRTPETA